MIDRRNFYVSCKMESWEYHLRQINIEKGECLSQNIGEEFWYIITVRIVENIKLILKNQVQDTTYMYTRILHNALNLLQYICTTIRNVFHIYNFFQASVFYLSLYCLKYISMQCEVLNISQLYVCIVEDNNQACEIYYALWQLSHCFSTYKVTMLQPN